MHGRILRYWRLRRDFVKSLYMGGTAMLECMRRDFVKSLYTGGYSDVGVYEEGLREVALLGLGWMSRTAA